MSQADEQTSLSALPVPGDPWRTPLETVRSLAFENDELVADPVRLRRRGFGSPYRRDDVHLRLPTVRAAGSSGSAGRAGGCSVRSAKRIQTS
jgi:hypothetical protein